MKLKLQDIAQGIQVGYQARGAVKEDPGGTHWIIQMRNLRDDGTIDPGTLTRFTPDRSTDQYTVSEGDVLLQVRGVSHEAGLVSGLPENTLASNHFYILQIDSSRVLSAYLTWYIRQPAAQSHLLKGAQGAGNITVVTRPVFESLQVPVPPMEAQQQIVSLDRLQWQERALIQELLTKRAQWLSGVSMHVAEGHPISTRNHA